MATAQATHPIIPPNIRVAVQQTVAPYTDHLHRHAGPSDDALIDEIRDVLLDYFEWKPMCPTIRDSEIAHIAAAAMVLLERRVIARRNAA